MRRTAAFTAEEVATYCGEDGENSIDSYIYGGDGTSLTLTFETDSSATLDGFQLQVTSLGTFECLKLDCILSINPKVNTPQNDAIQYDELTASHHPPTPSHHHPPPSHHHPPRHTTHPPHSSSHTHFCLTLIYRLVQVAVAEPWSYQCSSQYCYNRTHQQYHCLHCSALHFRKR